MSWKISRILEAHDAILRDSNMKSVFVVNEKNNVCAGWSRSFGNLKSMFG
jgi:hypothetical protein